jgi:hypothetical protein
MKQFIEELVEHFISMFFIMIFCAFALVAGVAPLILAEVYSGWYVLLYFVTIPTFFAICTVVDM